jgi:Domain of unknown function (DUF5666)
MEYDEEMGPTYMDRLPAPAPRRSGRRWLLIGGLALAFMLALGVAALMSSSPGTAQASALSSAGAGNPQTLVVQGDFNNAQVQNANPGPQGQCEALTVSSVSGQTIVAKTATGSSVTIHTTASTKYTQAGKTVAASVITVGTHIHVMGTHNSDGSITATSIDVG